MVLLFVFIANEYWHYRTPNIKSGAGEDSKINAINNWLDELRNKGKFNGAILIAKKGEIIFFKNVGFTDLTEEHLISNNSSFNLASASKQFTAYGILLLVKNGKLMLDDPIAKYIPELFGYEGVTVRHLLGHTSGIPEYTKLSKKMLVEDKIMTVSEMISWLGPKKAPLHFSPGEKFKYSNTGYVLLAEIIERVSGMTFSEFMKERIFNPLNMTDTAVLNQFSKTDTVNERVYGYRKQFYYFGKNVLDDLNQLDGIAGDGNIYSSALDLFKWDQALTKGTLLPKDFYKQAYEPGKLNSGKKTEYGFGWFVEKHPVVYHYGGWRSFSTLIRRNLDDQTVFIVLSNSGFFLRTASICDKIINELDF